MFSDNPCERELTKAQIRPFKEWAEGKAPLYPPGSFVYSIITNDLRGAFQSADMVNIHLIGAYVAWMYRYAPSGSWGSELKARNWLEGVNEPAPEACL